MSIGKKVGTELNGWISLALVIVIGSLVLLKFKTIEAVGTCTSGYSYNTSSLLCHNATNASQTATPTGVYSTIDTVVSSISEPKNWVVIFVVAMIGAAILMFFRQQGGGKGKSKVRFD